MFSLFIVSLSFRSSLTREQNSYLNSVERKYYPFMISLNNCTGSCNVLSSNICVPKEKKDINVKEFNMITNKNEAKAMTQHTSCDCKYKSNSRKCNSNQNGIIKHFNVNVKIIVHVKKIIAGILTHVFVTTGSF